MPLTLHNEHVTLHKKPEIMLHRFQFEQFTVQQIILISTDVHDQCTCFSCLKIDILSTINLKMILTVNLWYLGPISATW